MTEYDKLEELFDNLPKDRKIFIQKQYFEYNKYFEELNRGWWFDKDFKHDTVRLKIMEDNFYQIRNLNSLNYQNMNDELNPDIYSKLIEIGLQNNWINMREFVSSIGCHQVLYIPKEKEEIVVDYLKSEFPKIDNDVISNYIKYYLV